MSSTNYKVPPLALLFVLQTRHTPYIDDVYYGILMRTKEEIRMMTRAAIAIIIIAIMIGFIVYIVIPVVSLIFMILCPIVLFAYIVKSYRNDAIKDDNGQTDE